MSCGLRDVIGFEAEGMPAVLVASAVFERSAEHQSAQLGQPAARRVFVPHPVQDRTDEEVRALAGDAADALIEALTQRRRDVARDASPRQE